MNTDPTDKLHFIQVELHRMRIESQQGDLRILRNDRRAGIPGLRPVQAAERSVSNSIILTSQTLPGFESENAR